MITKTTSETRRLVRTPWRGRRRIPIAKTHVCDANVNDRKPDTIVPGDPDGSTGKNGIVIRTPHQEENEESED